MKTLFFAGFLLITQLTTAQDFELTSINLTVEDGLVGDNVYCAMQDQDGYIWFGTETGVSRYNGSEFENFYMADGLGGNEIFRIDQDRQGRIWFSAFNGRLSYFKEGRFFNMDNDSVLSQVAINRYYISMFEDSNQNIWLASKIRVSVIKKDGTVVNLDESSLGEHSRVGSFIERDGIVLGKSTSDEKVYNLTQALENQSSVTEITNSPHWNAFIQEAEVFLALPNSYSFSGYLTSLTSKPVSIDNAISKLHDYNDGDVWVCTFSGAFRISKSTGEEQRFMGDKEVAHVLKDRENGYWFTTLGDGVYYVPSLYNESIFEADNEPVGNATIVFSQGNKVWFGANRARVGQIEDGKLTLNTLYLTKGRSRTKKIIEGLNKDELLIVIEEGLILKKADGGFGRIDGSIKTIQHWKANLYAVGLTWGFVLVDIDLLYDQFIDTEKSRSRYESRGYRNKPFARESFLFSSVIDIESHQNGLFVASARGLYFMDEHKALTKVNGHRVMNTVINDIVSLNDSDYLLASGAYGLLMLQGGESRSFTTQNGLSSNIIRKVFVENDSTFWIATNAGIDRLIVAEEGHSVASIKRMDGLISEDVNDILIKEGYLWAATSKGISRIGLNDWEATKLPPLIKMKAMKVDGQPVSPGVEIRPSVKNINFSFDGLHFQSLNRLSYEYRLDGFDSLWKRIDRNTVDFSGLRPGDYRFQVKALSAFGSESELVQIAFTIATPVWATWWFISLLVIVVFVIVYRIVNVVINRNKLKEQRKYELQLKIAEAERKALQSQLNPHFIFNSLNSIQNMLLDNDTDGVYQYLAKFGKLIRRVLEFSDISMVSLAEELETLRLYMELENLRLNDKFDFEISVSEKVEQLTEVPSMLIQPYVENAIWHGITPLKGKRRGRIIISVSYSTEGLRFEVRDNGIGREAELNKKEEGLGTRIVNELVRKHKGERSGKVEIVDLYEGNQSKGTKVIVQLLPQLSI